MRSVFLRRGGFRVGSLFGLLVFVLFLELVVGFGLLSKPILVRSSSSGFDFEGYRGELLAGCGFPSDFGACRRRLMFWGAGGGTAAYSPEPVFDNELSFSDRIWASGTAWFGDSFSGPRVLRLNVVYAAVFSPDLLAIAGLPFVAFLGVDGRRVRRKGDRRVVKALFFAVVLVAVFFCGMYVQRVIGTLNSASVIVGEDSFQETASFVIWKEGATVYATKGSDGSIYTSGTDASTVIQSALNALTSGRAWKEKVLLKGNFVLSGKIRCPSMVTLDLREAHLKLGDNVNDVMIENAVQDGTATEIEIIGGELDGNKANNPTAPQMINMGKASNVKIINSYIHDARNAGIVFWTEESPIATTYPNILITGCRIENTDLDAIFISARKAVIANNFIKGVGDSGIVVSWGSDTIVVANNVIEDVYAYGIAIAGGAKNVSVVGNTIKGWKSGSTMPWGISVVSDDVSARKCVNVAIVGNTLIDVYRIGIQSQQHNENVVILGNVIKYISSPSEALARGIWIAANNIQAIIQGNIVEGARDHGIISTSSSLIVGNIVEKGLGFGITVADTSECLIESNIVKNMGDGIYILRCSKVLVVNNRAYDDQVPKTQQWGIHLDITGGSISNIYIFDNFLEGNLYGAIWPAGSDNKFKNNIGYVTENGGTATFSGDGTWASVTIAHGLASTPTTYYVQKASDIPQNIKYVTADATNLTVYFDSAPPRGTNNVVLKWRAEV